MLLLIGVGYTAYTYFAPKSIEEAVEQLRFDNSVTVSEQQTIRDAMQAQSKTYKGSLQASVKTNQEAVKDSPVLMAYVLVTNVYSSRQTITTAELKKMALKIPSNTDDKIRTAFAAALGLDVSKITLLAGAVKDMSASDIAFIPASELTKDIKLLSFDGTYYLDNFTKGAIFRQADFAGPDASSLADLKLNDLAREDTTLSVKMTGVTALTRVMMRKLTTVKDPLYFSEKIGDFLAEADITHVSNEVSFRSGCQYSSVSFCSPLEFIETLKDSGVDLVELTGNHNNDNGNLYNTESINLYHSLGMATFGGGLNSAEAAKPHLASQKGTTITFIGYNMADGPNSGAVAGSTTAGANHYNDAKAKADIAAARQSSQFVIVNIQYAECQAYPDGYVEFPLCDGTIGGQAAAFRKMIDYGADMVVGSSAHQPQTYELYSGKPIYYGLGNLYFDQTQWPGTERGIILTHYFLNGKLLQTKLSPTVYDRDLQTRLSDNEETVYLLERLNAAR
ncbi:CapA family protein [Candidatus Saccharibacteria bacterium]|nr:CapA family protein [Candidatus Saccharibacteria bacterium]